MPRLIMDNSPSLEFPNGKYNLLPVNTLIFNSEAENFLWAEAQADIGGYAFPNLLKHKNSVKNDLILSCYNGNKGT